MHFSQTRNPSDFRTSLTHKLPILIGTYTDLPIQGINHLYFSPEENILTVETIAGGIANPSFVIASKDGKRVFFRWRSSLAPPEDKS
ncbi:hypothetical protein [Algoriphagus boritolerans]|uniref:hypothetical protein n=1 Tax=Algoriphagus boritolerans TaxID=308111 RepID=UPI002FCDF8B4